MRTCEVFMVFFLSVLLCQVVLTKFNGTITFEQFKRLNRTILTSEQLNDAFMGVDSEFDLNQAIANFAKEDYANTTEDIAGKMKDLGPKPMKGHNYSSIEITNMLKAGQALTDTPTERKIQQLKRLMYKRDQKELKPKNITNIRRDKLEEKKRVKRQGKFQEAAKVDNLKMLRIYLTMFKNLWSNSYVGGAHPLHKDVPKAICILAKHRIMQFFFPPVGDDKKV